MKSIPEELSSINALVVDSNYDKLWSGVHTVSGADVELDIGTAGTDGQGVWVYGDNSSVGSESTAKVFGGYSVVDVETLPALTGITEAWLFGASIEVGLGSGAWSAAMTKYMKDEHNLDVEILTKAWGGQWVHAIEDKWDLEKDAVNGRSDLIVITMPIGNNISNTRTWADNMTEQDRIDLNTAYVQFMDNITNNGNIVAPVNTTFRDYDSTSVNNEQAGSLPYNENIIYPYAQSANPPMFIGDKPAFDPYNLTRNWYTYTFMDGDEIHLSNLGSQLMRTYYINNLAAMIKGDPLPVVDRVEDPVNNMTFPAFKGKCGLAYGYSAGSPMYAPFGFSTRDTGASSAELRLFAINGHELLNIVASSGITRTATTACVLPYPNTGEDTHGLVNDELKPKAQYIKSSTYVIVEKFEGLTPNQPFAVEILAISTAGTNPNYSAEISFDETTVAGTINSKWDGVADTQDHIHRFESTADASGVVNIYARNPTGSLGCYINALTIESI